MKIVKFSALAMVLLMISCQEKLDVKEVKEVEPSNEIVSVTKASGRHLYLGGEDIKTFCGWSGNCLPTVVVTAGSGGSIVSDVIETIEGQVLQEIKSDFQTYRSILSNYIPVVYIDGVINGNYLAKTSFGEEDANYVQFYNAENELVSAVPIVIN